MYAIEAQAANGTNVVVNAAAVQDITAITLSRTVITTADGAFTAHIPAADIMGLIAAARAQPATPPQ